LASHNHGSGNRYWTAEPEPRGEHFHWTRDLTTEAEFAKTPVGVGGAYLSVAERDRILGAEGIGSQPEQHVIPQQPLSRRTIVAVAAAVGLIVVVVGGFFVWVVRRRRRRRTAD
jgi:hypothetical protein